MIYPLAGYNEEIIKARIALEELSEETIKALIAQAATSGLSVEEYLQQLLGLKNDSDESSDLAMTGQNGDSQLPNEAMLAIIKEVAELQKDMRYTPGGEKTVDIIRQGRAGEMYGYDLR